MDSFNDFLQKYVNTDYEDLVSLAREAVARLMPVCKQVDPDHDGFYMLASLVLSALAADGKLTALEKKMLCDLFGMDDAGIKKLLGMYDSRMVDLADHFVDNMSADTKADALILICALAAVDEDICAEEAALIHKLCV